MKDEVGIVSTTQVVPGDYHMENIKSKLICRVSIIWLFRKSTSKQESERDVLHVIFNRKHYVCNNIWDNFLLPLRIYIGTSWM